MSCDFFNSETQFYSLLNKFDPVRSALGKFVEIYITENHLEQTEPHDEAKYFLIIF